MHLHAGPLELLEVAARGWAHGIIAPPGDAHELSLRPRERPCDHPPDGILALHHRTGRLARQVEIFERDALDVRRQLQHGVCEV